MQLSSSAVSQVSFTRRYLCLQGLISVIESSTTHARLMPNPLRAKSGGRMVLTVPLIVFMDDVSGNISKQWNKHHVIYMSNAALPREMLEKEFCVRFVSSSPHATPMELMCGFKESIVFVFTQL
jgi:hypothetical protein